MRNRRLAALVLSSVLLPAVVEAQGLVIDLAALDVGKTTTLSIGPRGEGAVTIVNLMPTKKYSFEVKLVSTPIDPLSTPTASAAAATLCSSPLAVVNGSLNNADSEKAVAKATADLLKLVDGCPVLDQPKIRSAVVAEITRLTVRTFPVPAIGLGQKLEVVITEDKRTWTAVFTTGPRGSWRVMSALAFTLDDNDTYHTEAAGSAFQIVKDRTGDRDLSFVPSVLFTWMPASGENSDHSHGFTAGLGFHKTTPSVLFGYHWTFNQNIGLVGGVMAQRLTRLAHQYAKDPLPAVKEPLEPGQLVRETYRARLFLAVTIRLSKPFSGLDETAKK